MSMNELGVRDFTDALASKTPIPCGGGAVALAAALGAALGEMVANFTIGKELYASVDGEMRRMLADTETLRRELLNCIDADAEKFIPLSEAYKLPEGTPGKEEELERCLRLATETPLRVMELCARGIALQAEYAEKGSRLLASDAGTGAVLFRAAMEGAALSVRANTKLMTDRKEAEETNRRAQALLEKYEGVAEGVFVSVYGRLG